ncbi:MAG: metal-dependent hydrolase [Oscillospiraceae bacterium]|nr:metal-dependent hydrolase [Oscillospiraceae bacterium]
MTGKTHKFIGIVVGGAAAYYGMTVLHDPIHLFYLAAVPVGAMIADIDHDRSKLGRSRKNILNAVSAIFSSLIAAAIIFYLIDAYTKSRLIPAILTVLLILIPFLLLTSLTKIDFVRNNLKFMVKHRGLMHTLIMPAILFVAAFYITEPTFKIVVTGLAIGYATHIFADLLTVKGCPILYPLSKKNISIMKIKTGTFSEYIAGFIVSVTIGAFFLVGIF